MPWGDWQFWVVTLLALGAMLWLLRSGPLWGVLLRLVGKKAKKKGSKATLTVGGKPVGK